MTASRIHRHPIATRNGSPAYLNAPPRLRQSDVQRVSCEQPTEQPRGFLAWLGRK